MRRRFTAVPVQRQDQRDGFVFGPGRKLQPRRTLTTDDPLLDLQCRFLRLLVTLADPVQNRWREVRLPDDRDVSAALNRPQFHHRGVYAALRVPLDCGLVTLDCTVSVNWIQLHDDVEVAAGPLRPSRH